MKVLVADEDSGSLKEIIFERGTDTSKQTQLQPESIETFAKEGRTRYIQRLLRVSDSQVLAARCDGSVELYSLNPVDGEKYKMIRDWSIGTATSPKEDAKDDKPDAVIELVMLAKGTAISCSRMGKVVKYNITEGTSESMIIKGPLDAFTIHPNQPNIVAVGGQERETEILELDWTKEEQKSIWTARNVKNDRLHLRVPVWVKRIYFLEQEEEEQHHSQKTDDVVYKFLVVTRYGQFRLYDTKLGRRPRQDIKISEHPISVCQRGTGDKTDTVVASDTKTSTYVVDIASLKMKGKLAGATGAVQALSAYTDKLSSSVMATGGLDRYLRVFDLETRSVAAKVFTGTQITAVLVLDGFKEEEDKAIFGSDKKRERESDEAENDELWNELDQVSAKQERSKKKKSSK